MAHKYSYSQISLYQSCPLKYRLRYIEQLVPLQGESEHDLRYGKAITVGLAELYAGKTVAQARKSFALNYPLADYPAQLPYWSPGKTFNNGCAVLGTYQDHWQQEDQYWDVISIEDIATTDDESRTVRLDLVIRDRRDGMVYGIDNKTTGKYLDAKYWSQYDPHSQIRQYVDYLQRKYGSCGGFYINALSFRNRTKAYTPRTGPDKGKQLPAGDWYAFGRTLFNPNTEAIKAERANLDNWIAKIEHDKATNQWAYNTDQCVKGPIVCEFHQICSAGYQWPRDRDLIESYYRQRCIRLAADGERCWLLPEHEGEHDSTKPEQPDFEIDIVEENIEEAVDA